MASRLDFNFSFSFDGAVWNTVIVPEMHQLIVEIRDDSKRQVTFSAIDYQQKSLIWKDLKVRERWWVNLLAADQDTIVLQQFHGNENPDKKTLIGLDVATLQERWRKEKFSFQSLQSGKIKGLLIDPEPVAAVFDAHSGEKVQEEINDTGGNEIFGLVRPFQYLEETPYFKTVSDFVSGQFGETILGASEYVESDGLIFISYYLKKEDGLANYLLVITSGGAVLLHEKLGERLKGLGVDTFFLLAGCLFYIRNKNELLSYILT